ncbi:hypothetical protein ACIP10_34605 [Streptomyces galbus]|uniref:hypothetical protein n=1 Tax=Streptomyces galbus TaxID=33898 RepID=UPI0037FA0AC4
MQRTQMLVVIALLTVFAWSLAMTAMGHVAAATTLAPALGLTVQQIVRLTRPRTQPSSEGSEMTRPDDDGGRS